MYGTEYEKEMKRIQNEVELGNGMFLTIKDMCLPVRAENLLRKAGMKTVEDVAVNLDQLRKMRGWGKATDWWVTKTLKDFKAYDRIAKIWDILFESEVGE